MSTLDDLTTRELGGLLVILESIEKMQCIASPSQVADMIDLVKEKYPFLGTNEA